MIGTYGNNKLINGTYKPGGWTYFEVYSQSSSET